MILDTNVLIARFDNSEPLSEQIEMFLDAQDFQWLVPSIVVVESWGILVGKLRRRKAGRALLTWLNTPGKATILPRHDEPLIGVADIVSKSVTVDCVDAMLAELADDMTKQCSLSPPMRIGTFDVGDYYTIRTQRGLRLTVYDARHFEDESEPS